MIMLEEHCREYGGDEIEVWYLRRRCKKEESKHTLGILSAGNLEELLDVCNFGRHLERCLAGT